MAEENQVTKEPQQVMKEPQQVMKEPQRVTMKDPNKVGAGKRLAAINRKKRKARKREEAQYGGMNQYYGFHTILALGVIGGLGYYIYRTKKGQVSREVPDRTLQAPTPQNPPPQQPCGRCVTPGPRPQTNKFEME